MNALPLILFFLAVIAIGYRYYSAFLAAKVMALDDSRVTPAHRFEEALGDAKRQTEVGGQLQPHQFLAEIKGLENELLDQVVG